MKRLQVINGIEITEVFEIPNHEAQEMYQSISYPEETITYDLLTDIRKITNETD
jgi:hypothetical protein